ncbi:MAG TPA: hypothetical protein VF260_11540 [Bacilli bacterium]
MAYFCPVCNGCAALSKKCPACGGLSEDLGRADAFIGPYAPYRPIDDLKMTNGFIDLATHQCVHITKCRKCGQTAYAYVNEQL